SGDVDQGEDLRIRIEQAELLENALPPAQPGEPVVDQRHFHRAASRYTSRWRTALSAQRKPRARTTPRSESSPSTRRSSSRSAPASPRGKCSAAPPDTSTSAGSSLAMHGVPQAIASTSGKPNPS